ncbi:AI-2E family transporter [Bacillus sp. FJAT-42376]|uniref:AI-2E family transporter n=1 Tax=Bacillus sp. FJAT-42376 TaxID=2014076 RepID=UPI000F513A58|nr:AI-2E family transporter [Bacillus sp. FJAT-42376]AZB44168.1 AI-2E family transporter [Bacillus sp. FJAT-42376]
MDKRKNPIIHFLGGRKTAYVLGILLLLGLNILLYSKVSFIFKPVTTFVETVALPVILAIVAYYLLRPLMRLLMKAGIGRTTSIFILLILIVGLIVLLIMSVVPFLIEQTKSLFTSFPGYWDKFITGFESYVESQSYLAPIYEDLKQKSSGIFSSFGSNASNVATETLSGFTKVLSAVTSVTIGLVTVPFILFYLLKEGEKLPKAFIQLIPPRMRGGTRKVFREIDEQVRAYIQGQLLVSLCIGIMLYIGFLIIGMDYALVLAAIASVTSVVPYLGPVIAITPAIIIAIVTSPFMLLKLAFVWTVVQLLEGKLISPQIMGKSLRVHPITIIFVLLTAGHLFGVIGVILGIPAYAILRTFVFQFYKLYKRRYNRYYATAENDERYEEGKIE